MPPIPTNTAGDDRLELWFMDGGLVGYAPGTGLYEPAWSVELPGFPDNFFIDFTGDGYADLLMAERDDEGNTEALYYYETQPEGSIGEVAVPIATIPGEGRARWRDIDRDGVLDRVVALDGELVWISGVDQGVHAIGLHAPAGAFWQPVSGDPHLWAFIPDETGPAALIRITSAGHEVLWEGPPRSLSHGARVHGDHIDVVELRSDDGESPFDIVLIRLDRDGRELDERVLAEQSHGMLMRDYDGDGERDLIVSPAYEHHIMFGEADHEYSEPEPLPAILQQDQGLKQSFDVDGDGGVELLLAIADDDGRIRWQALGWGACP